MRTYMYNVILRSNDGYSFLIKVRGTNKHNALDNMARNIPIPFPCTVKSCKRTTVTER